MADLVDGIWGALQGVIVAAAFALALCVGIVCFAVAFTVDRERERKQVDSETGWRTIQEGRLCNCTTNGLYRIQIKEN